MQSTHLPSVSAWPVHPSVRRAHPPGRTISRDETRGIALVLVLALIALCTVLVVAFLASITTDAVNERGAAAENSAAQLAGSAVQLVEGAITYATEPAGDTTYAWACQPGMIRTYGSASGGPGASAAATATWNPQAYFKLYSSDNMVVTTKTTPSIANFSLANDVPANWDTMPSLYTDLNAPLLKQVASGGAAPTTTVVFPILDPRAQDLGVEGFEYVSASLDGAIQPTGTYSADSNIRLPMPVKWMYVLKDGTMTVPSGATSTGASWSGATAAAMPTAANPIVGRVAFWTDDESAKVNVNTASEGTYWDTPVANSGKSGDQMAYPVQAIGDVTFSTIQGAQKEYQRYPGHPATTCLSTVFGSALSGLGSRATIVKAITDATPRVTDSAASTMGGTQAVSGSSLVTDLDRLYASLDEFQFLPLYSASTGRSVQTLGLGGTQATTEQNQVDSCRFFLTAHSKAPELNLFGLPRVAMWPLWDDAHMQPASAVSYRSTFDQEIFRCSTMNAGPGSTASDPHEFAFFRGDPTSPTADWTTQQSIGLSSPQMRNQQVYGYLQTLLGRAVPGFGTNFTTKYGATDAAEVLTEIFDYIRCTNLADQSAGANPDGTYKSYTQTNAPPPTAYNNRTTMGQVVPIQINATRGMGRIATISELALLLVKCDDRAQTSVAERASNLASSVNITVQPGTPPEAGGAAPGTSYSPGGSSPQTLVEWTLIPKLFSPLTGYGGLANNLRIHVTKLQLQIGANNGVANNVTTQTGSAVDLYDTGRLAFSNRDSDTGGNIGCTSLVENVVSGGGATTLAASPIDSMYPSGLCLVDGSSVSGSAMMTISGTVSLEITTPGASAPTGLTPVQTFTFTFPSTTVPIPKLPVTTAATYTMRNSSYTATAGTGGATTGSFMYIASPLKNSSSAGRLCYFDSYILSGDVVRSLVPTGAAPLGGAKLQGDMRVIALTPSIPDPTEPAPAKAAYSPALKKGGAAAAATDNLVHSLRNGVLAVSGNAQGSLVSAIPYGNYGKPPEAPAGAAGVQMTASSLSPLPWGDWDNGPGLMMDGPFMNKPDEGVTASQTGNFPYVGGYQITSQAQIGAATLFSPNRQVSSPVMFGSLPIGTDHPWQTLLFRPATLPGYQGGYTHPGNLAPYTQPADHLLLDLFWMPVVEPYGISEPLATSGKINLNTQIAPFTYITRTTGLRAVLKSVMITALNPNAAGVGGSFIQSYKAGYNGAYNNTPTHTDVVNATVTRYPIDLDQTLSQITQTPLNATPPADTANPYPEFARATHTVSLPNFFVSASQICDLPLIPQGSTPSTLSTFWTNNSLTGDNSLERPYSLIYPRVTTKSSIFTVHVIAQSLRKITTDPNQNVWNEYKDQVLSESRAAYTIEKYFDPNTDDLTSDAAGKVPCLASLDGSISPTAGLRTTKWRLLGVKRFGQ